MYKVWLKMQAWIDTGADGYMDGWISMNECMDKFMNV